MRGSGFASIGVGTQPFAWIQAHRVNGAAIQIMEDP